MKASALNPSPPTNQLPGHSWGGQALRFLVVGASNTLIDACLYLLLTRLLGFGSLPALAKAISYSAGVLNSFYWNRSWTFRSRASARTSLLPFLLVNLASVLLNSAAMSIGLALHLPEPAAFVLATSASLIWNFIWSKRVFSVDRL